MEYDYGCVQYEYKMVQMPQTVRVSKEHRKEKAAHYLETLANEQAADGWEFHRIDRVGTVTSPGFLARLMGAQSVRVEYCVVTFRRPVLEAAAEADMTYPEQAPVMTPDEMAYQEAMLEPEEAAYQEAVDPYAPVGPEHPFEAGEKAPAQRSTPYPPSDEEAA